MCAQRGQTLASALITDTRVNDSHRSPAKRSAEWRASAMSDYLGISVTVPLPQGIIQSSLAGASKPIGFDSLQYAASW